MEVRVDIGNHGPQWAYQSGIGKVALILPLKVEHIKENVMLGTQFITCDIVEALNKDIYYSIIREHVWSVDDALKYLFSNILSISISMCLVNL